MFLFLVMNKGKNQSSLVKNQLNVDNAGNLVAFLKVFPNVERHAFGNDSSEQKRHAFGKYFYV